LLSKVPIQGDHDFAHGFELQDSNALRGIKDSSGFGDNVTGSETA